VIHVAIKLEAVIVTFANIYVFVFDIIREWVS